MYVASTICGKQMHFSHPLAVADSSRVARVVIKIIPTAEAAWSWLRTCPSVYHIPPTPGCLPDTEKHGKLWHDQALPKLRAVAECVCFSLCVPYNSHNKRSLHTCVPVCVCVYIVFVVVLTWNSCKYRSKVKRNDKPQTKANRDRFQWIFSHWKCSFELVKGWWQAQNTLSNI